jgi:CBS domain containing-hemolysin-like protein
LEEALEGYLSLEALERPQALNMSLMLWNQTLLVLLLILLWPFRYSLPGAGWMLAALMLIYVWAMDIVLPAVVISANPAAWIERLFPLYFPVHKLLVPLLAPLSAYREKSQQAQERAREEDDPQTEEVIEAFLEEGEAEGILEEEDSELIRNVVNLGDTIVREVMTPRNRIQGIPSDATLDEVWEAFRVNRYSRMPVYQSTIENIQGVLLLKDLIQIKWQEDTKWISIVKPPIFVPESKPTLELLRELQRARSQMAIVVDEYGAVAGLSTVEDLLEEVVGEIQDEHESTTILHESSPGVYSVPGETHVDDLASALDIELEHEGFDTVAGLVMWKLGRIPNPLETVRVQTLVLRVLKMEGPRIILVEARVEGI